MLWKRSDERVARCDLGVFVLEAGRDVAAYQGIARDVREMRGEPHARRDGGLPHPSAAEDDPAAAAGRIDAFNGYVAAFVVMPELVRRKPMKCREVAAAQEVVNRSNRVSVTVALDDTSAAAVSFGEISALRMGPQAEIPDQARGFDVHGARVR